MTSRDKNSRTVRVTRAFSANLRTAMTTGVQKTHPGLTVPGHDHRAPRYGARHEIPRLET